MGLSAALLHSDDISRFLEGHFSATAILSMYGGLRLVAL